MKKNQDPFLLRELLVHSIHLNLDSDCEAVRLAFADCPSDYIAIIAEDRSVIGLLDRVTFHRDLQPDPTLSIREAMNGSYTSVDADCSPERALERALARDDAHVMDDLILVDENNCLIGLISVAALLRFQQGDFREQPVHSPATRGDEKETFEKLGTELADVHAELEKAQSVVKEMRSMRSEFVAKFGYEARTPMTSIMGMLNLLLDTEMNDDQRRMVRSAGSSAFSLLRLIDSVLDFSRIELGDLTVGDAQFDPVETINQAIRNTREEADEKELVLDFAHEGITPTALGDEKRFRQVVENLLGRAIDQTYCGGIKISLSQEFSGDKFILNVEILDSGINEGLGDVDTIFAPFDEKPFKSEQGDLVTMLSCRIAEKMGGSVKEQGDDQTAPRFVFRVPLGLPEAMIRQNQRKVIPFRSGAPASSNAKLRPLELLLVDDNRTNLEVARRFLLKNNCKVHLADSGREGLKILSENYIDGILMDCQMPDLSGYETVELIRSGEAGEAKSEVFVVAITADDSAESRTACERVGMNDFIAKPVRAAGFEKLVKEIRAHVSSVVEPGCLFASS